MRFVVPDRSLRMVARDSRLAAAEDIVHIVVVEGRRNRLEQVRHMVAVGDSLLEVGIVVGERHMAVEELRRIDRTVVGGSRLAVEGIVAEGRHTVVAGNHLVVDTAVEEHHMVVEGEGFGHKEVAGNLHIRQLSFCQYQMGILRPGGGAP